MGKITLNNGLRSDGDEFQFLTFLLGDKVFGIDIKALKEIIKYVTPKDLTPRIKSFDGFVELRGMKVPVLDLRRLFSFGVTITEKSRIILLLIDGHVIGLIVDEVMDVEILDPDTEVIMPVSPTKGASGEKEEGAYMKYVDGVIRGREKRDDPEGESAPKPGRDESVMMLNPETLLTKKD